jgi:hypothetical protein
MIGFTDPSLYNLFLYYNQYSTIANLHTFQFTTVHTLGFSAPTNRILAMDLNTETITSNHYEVFLPFLVQSPWNANPPELDPILTPVSLFLNLYSFVLIHATNRLLLYRRGVEYIEKTSIVARIVVLPGKELNHSSTENTDSIVACWNKFTKPLPSNALSKSATISKQMFHLTWFNTLWSFSEAR